ncbi:MAG: sigma-70 family RNA polymerase sigma factor [Verrucomicrobiota bacterium]|nr:sigma-70 family RNA polymerase sigma factor [Verrucomicrobiota bacterium]
MPDPGSFEDDDKPLSITDAELVRQTQEGRTEAFDELIERYKKKIYGLVYHMTGNPDDSNDLMFEIFEKAFFSIKNFKGNSSFSTWIYQISKNHVINYGKKRKNKVAISMNDLDTEALVNGEIAEFVSLDSTDRDVKIKELQKKLNEALAKLSEDHRIVVVMHDIEGMTSAEIGKVTKCSEGTVRSRLHYARQQLQTYLKEYLN